MVMRILLSHDGLNYVEAFSNGAYFTSIIEDNNIATDEGFTYGDTPQITTLQLNYSGTHAQVSELLSYQHIQVYSDNRLIFAGYNPSNEEHVVTDEVRNGAATYSSYASYFETVTFAEDIEYLYPDGIKICDPEDVANSLVHILFARLIDTAPQIFTLECTYVDNTIVPSFVASVGDSIYAVFSTLLAQLGLAFCINNYTIRIIDMLETPSGIAENIVDFESGMLRTEKAYETKELPKIRTCEYHKVTDTQIGQLQSSSNKIIISAHTESNFDVSLQYKAGDNTKVVLYSPKGCRLVGATHGFISGYGVELYGWRKIGPEQVRARVYNEHAIFDYSFQNILVNGDVAYLDYNHIVIPQDTDPNMPFVLTDEEKKVDYLTTDAQALRYLKALLYGQYMDSRTYEVYTTQDLALNTYCSITGETGFFRVIRKQCTYDAFKGYTYTLAAIFNDGGLQYNASYVAPVADLPPLRPSLVLQASRYNISYRPSGALIDNTPIRIFINSLNVYIQPVVRVNGQDVQLTPAPDSSLQTDEAAVGDSGWYYDLDPHTFDVYDTVIVSAEIAGGDYKEIHINRVDVVLKNISAQYYMSASDTSLIPNCFVITQDTEKQSGKIYYEFSVATGFVIATDATFIEGKTYYEDAGWLDQIVYSTSGNYFLDGVLVPTADIAPQVGKTYYVWDDLTEEYVVYIEPAFVQGVTYYEWQDADSFIWSRQKYRYSDDSEDFSDYSYYLTRADISSAFILTYLYNISTSNQFEPTEDTTPQVGKEYYIYHNGTWEVCDTTSGSFPTSIIVYEIPGAAEWQPNIPAAWNANLYIWIRESIEYARGNVVVNVPRFSLKTTQDMLANCIFDIQLSSYIWEKDARDTSANAVTITLKYDIRGYGNATPIIAGLPQAVAATTEDGITVLSFPASLALSSFTFTVSLDGFPQVPSRAFTIEAVDVTLRGKHFEPTNIVKATTTYEEGGITYNYVKGDYYLYRETAVGADSVIYNTVLQPKYFDGEQWVNMLTMPEKDANALLQLIPDVFQYADGENAVSIADYSFFKNIVAQNLTTELLYSIYIQVGRAIYGGAFQADGTNPTGGQGFHLSKDGILQAFNAILTDATITGHFKSSSFETKDAQIAGHLTANATGSYIQLQELYELLDTYNLQEGPVDYPAALNKYGGQAFRRILYKAPASNYSQSFNRTTAASVVQGTAVTTTIIGNASASFTAPFALKLLLNAITRLGATYKYNTYSRTGTYTIEVSGWESSTGSESGWMSSVPTSQSRPANPQDGDTYRTYTQTRRRTYYYWRWEKEVTTGSWNLSTTISGWDSSVPPSESRPSNPSDGDTYTVYTQINRRVTYFWNWEKVETTGSWRRIASGSDYSVDSPVSESRPSNPSDGDTYTVYSNISWTGAVYEYTYNTYQYSLTTTTTTGSGAGSSVPSNTSTTTYTVTSVTVEYQYTITVYEYSVTTNTTTGTDEGTSVPSDTSTTTYTVTDWEYEYKYTTTTWTYANRTETRNDGVVIGSDQTGTAEGSVLEYSINGGAWTSAAADTAISLNYGDTIVFRQAIAAINDKFIYTKTGNTTVSSIPAQWQTAVAGSVSYTYTLSEFPTGYTFINSSGTIVGQLTSDSNNYAAADDYHIELVSGADIIPSLQVYTKLIQLLLDNTTITSFYYKAFTGTFNIAYQRRGESAVSITSGANIILQYNSGLLNIIQGASQTTLSLNEYFKSVSINVTPETVGAHNETRTLTPKELTDTLGTAEKPFDVTYTNTLGGVNKPVNTIYVENIPNYVPNSRKINNKSLSADIALTASDVGAAPANHTHSGYVPTSRTVNGKALSSNIALNASDVGAQAAMLTINGSASGSGSANFTINYTLPSLAVGQFARINSVVFTATNTKTSGFINTTIVATCNIKLPSGGKYLLLGAGYWVNTEPDEWEYNILKDTIAFPDGGGSQTSQASSASLGGRILFSSYTGNNGDNRYRYNNQIMAGATTIYTSQVSIAKNSTQTKSFSDLNHILWRLS